MKLLKLSFKWDIKNYNDCNLFANEFFDSPRFSVDDSTFKSDWKLRVYPAGFEIGTKKCDNLSVLLLRLDSGSTFCTTHSISFLNHNGSPVVTKGCTKLCQTSKLTTPTAEILKAANIIEMIKNANGFVYGGILSVLCEIEIYEKTEDFVPVTGAHLQMLGTSCVLRIKHQPTIVPLRITNEFYLPYGRIPMRFEYYCVPQEVHFRIIDEMYPAILEVPVTLVLGAQVYNFSVTRERRPIILKSNDGSAFKISTRCFVDSTIPALPIDIIPCLQKIKSDFQAIFSQPEGGDISIAVDGKIILAHWSILSGRCPVFAAMFRQEWREQTTRTVTINDFAYETILAMIEFIYYGGNDDNDADAVDQAELLKAAHMYQLDQLKMKCEQRLCQGLDKNNVDSCIQLAYVYDLTDLKNEAIAFRSNNKNN